MLETIFNHKSIRKYKNKPIEEEITKSIIEAGIRASNTGNMQAYSIIVTKNATQKEKLWEQHFRQDMVRQAPLILTFCADLNRFNKWCKLRDCKPAYNNFLWFYTASIDAVIAAQNVAIAAESYNLGICYLGTTNYNADKIIEILELPEGVVPVTTLVVGYPDETPNLTDRLPSEAVVHYEKYNDFSEKNINTIYKEIEESEFTKQLIKENETDNLAQIFTEKRYIEKNNIHFSKTLIEVIKKQGFM